MSVTHFTEERCVMCGEIIEEGRQVCQRCDRKIFGDSAQSAQPAKMRPAKRGGILERLLNRKGE